MKFHVLPLMLFLTVASATRASGFETLRGSTELRYWDESRAWNGYTLFPAYYNGTFNSYLIDMEGRLVRSWPTGANPRFLDNGNVLDATRIGTDPWLGLVEMDWEGDVVWQYLESRPDYQIHHDFVRIHNAALGASTTLFIANRRITHASALGAGADPAKGPYDGAQLDAIVEIDMAGRVVWEWWFFDHLIQDESAAWPNHAGADKSVADWPGRLDVNLPGKPLSPDWLHCNSLDYNPELDQLVVNSVWGEFYVIDHGGTFVPGDRAASVALGAGPAGDFLYRFGDPARYGQGDPPSIREDWTASTTGHKQIGASHHVHWIAPGLSGAGRLLVFNNGQFLFERTPQSYLLEVDPTRDATGTSTGSYVNPPDAGYTLLQPVSRATMKAPKQISNQVVWTYHAKSNQSFFSHIGSGAQRLPGGNTLVCAMTEGHLFEITPDETLVWEYVSPLVPNDVVTTLVDSLPLSNGVFRALRYAPDDAVFAGRDLTPLGLIAQVIGGITPTSTPTPTASPTFTATPTSTGTPVVVRPEDINGDGIIDYRDLLRLIGRWQE